MHDTLEIQITKTKFRTYLKISPAGNLHVFVPYTTGGTQQISADNTCKTLIAIKEALGLSERNSILSELQLFKQECQENLQRCIHYRQAQQFHQTLIQQADWYIAAIEALTTTYRSSLTCLNSTIDNSFGAYPSAIQDLFRKSNRNVFSMLLRPDVLDTFITAVQPVFSVQRPLSPMVTAFKSIFRTLKLPARTPLAQLREQIANSSFQRDRTIGRYIPLISAKLTESKLFFVATNDQISGVDVTSLNQLFGYRSTETFDDVEELGAWIRGIMSRYSPQYARAGLFKELDFFANGPDDQLARACDLCIRLQFFLGEANIYARYLNLSPLNFADTLEKNVPYSQQLANLVCTALRNDTSADHAILTFINTNFRMFGLSRAFTLAEQTKILELFNTHFVAIQAHIEKDEFTIHYDKKPDQAATSYILCNNMNFHLIDILNQAPYLTDSSFNTLRSSPIRDEIPTLPSTLSKSDEVVISITRVSRQTFITEMHTAIRSNNLETLKKLLLKTVQHQFVFTVLGADFFRPYYTNAPVQRLFEQLRNDLSEAELSEQFTAIVRGNAHSAQLIIDHHKARCLHTALEDRRELSINEGGINRVLEYKTPHALTMILRDLRDGERDTNGNKLYEERDIYPGIGHYTVTQQTDGNVLIDGSQQTIDTINQILTEYQHFQYIPMITASGVYKMVYDMIGPHHPNYSEMMRLSNNVVGDPTPYKFKKALDLLRIRYTHVSYNNRRNTKAVLSETNQANPSIKKKGGSGFIISGLSSDHMSLLEQITKSYANRMALDEKIRMALYRKIHDLGGFKELLEAKDSGKHILETALIMLGIDFSEIGLNPRIQDFDAILPPEEQAKLRVITKSYYPNDRDFPALNNEDKQYTRGYTPALIRDSGRSLHDLIQAKKTQRTQAGLDRALHVHAGAQTTTMQHMLNGITVSTSRMETIELSPEDARSIYVAVQDRTDLPLRQVLHYHTPEAMRSLLNTLYLLSCRQTRYDDMFHVFSQFEVASIGHGSLKITARAEAIAILREHIRHYRHAIHLSMDMNAAIYKALSEAYGDHSPEIRHMNTLNNNTPNDPTPYKMIAALKLFLKRDIRQSTIRYNNTLNNLDYKRPANEHNGLPKKGGSGYIMEGLSDQDIDLIERCTEEQTYMMRLDGHHIWALYDLAEQLNRSTQNVLNQYEEGQPRLDALLTILGFKFKDLRPSATDSSVFILKTDSLTQSFIKKTLKTIFEPALKQQYGTQATVSHAVVLVNKEDEERISAYRPALIPGWNNTERVNAAKRLPCPAFPPVLPYRHGIVQQVYSQPSSIAAAGARNGASLSSATSRAPQLDSSSYSFDRHGNPFFAGEQRNPQATRITLQGRDSVGHPAAHSNLNPVIPSAARNLQSPQARTHGIAAEPIRSNITFAIASFALGAGLTAINTLIYAQSPLVGSLLALHIPTALAILSTAIGLGLLCYGAILLYRAHPIRRESPSNGGSHWMPTWFNREQVGGVTFSFDRRTYLDQASYR